MFPFVRPLNIHPPEVVASCKNYQISYSINITIEYTNCAGTFTTESLSPGLDPPTIITRCVSQTVGTGTIAVTIGSATITDIGSCS